MSDTLKHSFKTSLPVMAGYIVLGIGFGIMMADRGFAWYRAALMSLTVYAGSMQYVAVDLIGGAFGRNADRNGADGADGQSAALFLRHFNARKIP